MQFSGADDPIRSVVDASAEGGVVLAWGDEALVGEERKRWLQALNTGRDQLRNASATVIFAFGDSTLNEVATRAIDFWSARTGLYGGERPQHPHDPPPRRTEAAGVAASSLESAYAALTATEGYGSEASGLLWADPLERVRQRLLARPPEHPLLIGAAPTWTFGADLCGALDGPGLEMAQVLTIQPGIARVGESDKAFIRALLSVALLRTRPRATWPPPYESLVGPWLDSGMSAARAPATDSPAQRTHFSNRRLRALVTWLRVAGQPSPIVFSDVSNASADVAIALLDAGHTSLPPIPCVIVVPPSLVTGPDAWEPQAAEAAELLAPLDPLQLGPEPGRALLRRRVEANVLGDAEADEIVALAGGCADAILLLAREATLSAATEQHARVERRHVEDARTRVVQRWRRRREGADEAVLRWFASSRPMDDVPSRRSSNWQASRSELLDRGWLLPVPKTRWNLRAHPLALAAIA